MTSQAQIDANRRNSTKSTGPKNTSLTSSNALKHRLTANRFVVLPVENSSDYKLLVERMYKDYQPQTVLEEILIERMVNALWRLRRIQKSEGGEIDVRLDLEPFDVTMRYESTLERQFYRAALTLKKIQEDRIGFVSQKP